jgi:CheY-like chemotaxis protein
VFSVCLPCAAAPVAPAVAEAARPAPEAPGSVLVIDDDPELRESMQGLLLEWGYPAVVAGSLEQAVAAARAEAQAKAPDRPFSLILSDYQIAGKVTGIDAIGAVAAALGRTVPAVIITGDTSPGPVAAAKQYGYRILYKPVEPGALLALIEELAVEQPAQAVARG